MVAALICCNAIAPFAVPPSLWVSADPTAREVVSDLPSAPPPASSAWPQAPRLRRRRLDLSSSKERNHGGVKVGLSERRKLKDTQEKKPPVKVYESARLPLSTPQNAKRPPHPAGGANVVAEPSNSGEDTNDSSGKSKGDRPPIKRGSGLLDLSSYIDPDTILYDVVQGFLLATLLCGFLVLTYRLCLGCLVRCHICPDDRLLRAYHRRHRHRSRVGGFGGPNRYEMVGQEDNDSAWDDESSAVDSDVSMEYGHAFLDDDDDDDSDEGEEDGVRRFSEIQINRAAEGYFDREEEQERMLREVVERQRQEEEEEGEGEEDNEEEKKASSRNGVGSDVAKASGNGVKPQAQAQQPNSQKRRRKKKKKKKSGGSRGGISCASSILDDEDEDDLPPLDLELIERRAAEEIGEDGADLIQPSPLAQEEEDEAKGDEAKLVLSEAELVVSEADEGEDEMTGEGGESGTSIIDEVDSDESFGPTEEEMNF